ncbi:hypothetical protein L873DRAFT_1698707, partial [Choiromyces venosus 120613-1]
YYSRYKKIHSIKFQIIIAPDGLIIYLFSTFLYCVIHLLYSPLSEVFVIALLSNGTSLNATSPS